MNGKIVVDGICHIVAAGPGALDPFELGAGDYLIAADGGCVKCAEAGLEPNLAVGDFDSVPILLLCSMRCTRMGLPCEKDDTDLAVALRCGLDRGYRRFVVHCALGGDLGHTAAALRLLHSLRREGIQAQMQGAGQTALLVLPEDGPVHLNRFSQVAPMQDDDIHKGTRVSVFAFGGDASGVTARGLRWELEEADLQAFDALGVSNVAASGDPVIRVGEGCLLVILDNLVIWTPQTAH